MALRVGHQRLERPAIGLRGDVRCQRTRESRSHRRIFPHAYPMQHGLDSAIRDTLVRELSRGHFTICERYSHQVRDAMVSRLAIVDGPFRRIGTTPQRVTV